MYEDWIIATDDAVWQGPDVDYGKVRSSGVRAVWHRCGYGVAPHPRAAELHMGKDSLFEAHRASSRAAGLRQGIYFFPVPHATTPEQSAEAVLRYTGGDRGDLPFMIDMENPSGVDVVQVMGPQRLADWMIRIGELLVAEWGPGIAYIGGFYGMAAAPGLLGPYRWNWTANYGSDHDFATLHGPDHRPAFAPAVHGPWTTMHIFQHSGDNGRVPGYPGGVDIDLIEPTAWLEMTGSSIHSTTHSITHNQEDDMAYTAFTVGSGSQWYIDGGKALPIQSQEHLLALVKLGIIRNTEPIEISDPGQRSALTQLYQVT